MKKKFSFVLAILMIVCTLSIALVACTPKDPEAFVAASKGTAYGQIWDAWVKSNGYTDGDSLGIDLKIEAKNTKDASITDLTILLQAGLDGVSGSEKEAIRLAIIDNNKKDDIIDMAVNKDGLYFDALGMEKPLLFTELALPYLGVGEDGAVNSTLRKVKEIFVDLVLSLIGTDVTIDPKLGENKLYDLEYTFGLDFSVILMFLDPNNGIMQMLPDTIPAALKNMIAQVVPFVRDALDGLEVDFKITTTGNERKKVEKPAKGEPKYDYVGGKVQSISAIGSKDEESLSISFDGLKLNSALPKIELPTASEVVNTSLLKHKLSGEINLKDIEDNIVSTYTYQIDIEFTADNILDTVVECVNSKSASPLLRKLFTEQAGKLFIELYHSCGEYCQVDHKCGDFDGSVFAVAYSPEEFDNNRIYMSFDLNAILTQDFLSEVFGEKADGLEIPNYYTQFSFDFLQYIELLGMRGKDSKDRNANAITINKSEEAVFSLDEIIAKIIAGVKQDNELQIETIDINAIFENIIKPMLKENGIEEETCIAIDKAVNNLLNGISKICANTVYENGKDIDFSILELYKRKNDTELKNFGGNENVANNKVIKGKPKYELDKSIQAKIFYSNDLSSEPSEFDLLYDEQGNKKDISYTDFMKLVDSEGKGTAGKIKYTYTDLLTGVEVTAYSNIVEVVGLDSTKIGVEQEIALVLYSGQNRIAGFDSGIGSNLNNLFGVLSVISPEIAKTIIPELVVKIKITLS